MLFSLRLFSGWPSPALPWLLFCLLSGCATPRPWLDPLPPSALNAEVQGWHHLTMVRGEESRSMQVALQVDAEQLTMVGLSDLGQRLFTLISDGQQAKLTSQVPDLRGLDPDWILTELQLVYWPLSALQAALPVELRLEQQAVVRTLWHDRRLLWLAVTESRDIRHGEVVIYNLRLGYRLNIRPLAP